MAKYNDMGVFVFILIASTLGIAFLIAAANSVADSTNRVTVVNEGLDISSARIAGGGINESKELSIANLPTSWKLSVSECLPGATGNGFVLKNQSATTMAATTDYIVYSRGNLTLKNVLNLNRSSHNITNLSYYYCSENYVPGSNNQSVLGLVILFFSIAIVVTVIVYFLKGKSYDKITRIGS
jgi:hypothetical protein